MWSDVKIQTPPSLLPISTSDLKARLRIDHDEEDQLLAQFLREAVGRIDGPNGIGYAMMRQQWQLALEGFPYTNYDNKFRYNCGNRFRRRLSGLDIFLLGAPVVSVESIKYLDVNGVEQTVSPDDYRVEVGVDPAVIVLRRGKAWPSSIIEPGAVKILYTLGVETVDGVPADLIGAVGLFAAHRYENREAVTGSKMSELPLGFQDILNDYRQAFVAQ